MENSDVEKTWNMTNEYITKLINSLEEGNLEFFNSSAEAMAIYDIVFSFASRLTQAKQVMQIYKRFKQTLKMYISSKVLPALREKRGEAM